MTNVLMPTWAARAIFENLENKSSAEADALAQAICAAMTSPLTPRSSGLLGKRCLIDGEVEAVLVVDKPDGGEVEVATVADLPGGVDTESVDIKRVLVVASREDAVRDVATGWQQQWARMVDFEQEDPWVEALGHAAQTIERVLND